MRANPAGIYIPYYPAVNWPEWLLVILRHTFIQCSVPPHGGVILPSRCSSLLPHMPEYPVIAHSFPSFHCILPFSSLPTCRCRYKRHGYGPRKKSEGLGPSDRRVWDSQKTPQPAGSSRGRAVLWKLHPRVAWPKATGSKGHCPQNN